MSLLQKLRIRFPIVALKTGSELALCLAASQTVTVLLAQSYSLWVPAGILWLMILMGWLLEEKRLIIRSLPILISTVVFHCVNGWTEALLLLPGWLYCVMVQLRKGYEPDYNDARKRFYLCTGLLVGICLLVAVFASHAVMTMNTDLLPWALLYLSFSVCLLRLLRHDTAVAGDVRFHWLNTVAMVGLLSVAALLGSTLMSTVLIALWDFIKILFTLLSAPFAWLLGLLMGEQDTGGIMEAVMDETEPQMEILREHTVESVRQVVQMPVWIWLVPILLLVFGLVLFLMWGMTGRHASPTQIAEQIRREKLEPSFGKTAKATKAAAETDNSVRRIYKSFIRLCRRKGIPAGSARTTRELRTAAGKVFADKPLEALETAYRVARYDPENLSEEDSIAARQAWKEINIQGNRP